MNPRTLLRLTLGISIVFTVAIISAYLMKFSNFSFSDNSQIWGAFGDYFGGILNPLIGILNLVVLVYITFQIAQGETERNKNNLYNQRQFALYSLKHDSLKELNRILEQVQLEYVKSDSESELKLIFIRNDLNAYITTHSYLFPSFSNKSWEPLRDSLEALTEISVRYFKSVHSLNLDIEILPELRKFNDLKIAFIVEVQNQII